MKIETRSIEFVPHREGYGRPRRLFSVWFSSNLQVTALMVGTLGVASGLNVLWTLAGLALGCLLGTIFMAAHSAQGPHLGVPQMIQSRAQFGVLGAAIPLLVMVTAAVLFMAASGVLMRDPLKGLLGVTDDQAIVLIGITTFLIGAVGYELIHRLGAWMSVLSSIVFGAALVLILTRAEAGQIFHVEADGFSMPIFNLVVAQAASWTLGYGPYVADYSRYLPADVSARHTFWTTYFGCALGSLGMMALGAVLAAAVPSALSVDPGTAIASLFGPWAKAALIVVALGVIQYNVLCLYSAYMSTTTIFSGFAKVTQVTQGAKLLLMAILSTVACAIAIRTQYHFDTFFADILIGQLYLLIPWSAINLVDYYVVARGRYHIDALYDAQGRYGRWNRRTLIVYGVSIIGTVPFMKLSFHEGYFAQLIGADVSWIAGLALASVLYYICSANRQSVHRNIVATRCVTRAAFANREK